MNGKQLNHALHAGKLVFGTAIYAPSPTWAGRVKQLGIDMVFIDSEHTPHDRGMISWMCQTYSALDIAPVVRIPAPDPYMAQMVLDGGASGVIAPYVESPEQVKALGGAVKFGPVKGDKLRGMVNGNAPEAELEAYLAEKNASNNLFINIESVPALNALDDILAVPFIDAVLVGPHDLSCSLGIPERYEHPVFEDAIQTIIAKSRAAGVGVGIHHNSMQQQIGWVQAGANLVMHSSDVSAFLRMLTAEFQEIRAAVNADSGRVREQSVNL